MRNGRGGLRRARIYATIVALAGIVGMVAYGFIIRKPFPAWPPGDLLVMLLTTLIAAAVVRVVTAQLLGRNGRAADG